MDTSQSNSAYTINDSSVGDDDVNDIIEMEEEIEKGLRLAEQKAPRQRKLTSQVWSLFRKVLRDKYPDNKPRAVCKRCGTEYVAVRNSDRSDGLSTRVPKFEAHVFAAKVALDQLLCSEDVYMKTIAQKMIEKFEKYWSDFCTILAIAELKHVRDKLFLVFGEYNLITPSSSSTSVLTQMSDVSSSAGRNDNGQSTLNQRAMDMFKEFDDFDSMDCSAHVRKSELELYLDEPKIDRKFDLDILIASESAFSVGGRVLDQFRSVLKPETVQTIITTRDWMFGEFENFDVIVDQLTHNIMNMSTNCAPSAESANNPNYSM
ncbi:hypothetical protein WN944_001048 [Citrus x changshan-huyou]|uniref:BED-type domain-containing protein n=1 Tax=Citrus x changshan-huyou TaxID=2935761 RepID=A0AAP0MFN3_9ROSI